MQEVLIKDSEKSDFEENWQRGVELWAGDSENGVFLEFLNEQLMFKGSAEERFWSPDLYFKSRSKFLSKDSEKSYYE